MYTDVFYIEKAMWANDGEFCLCIFLEDGEFSPFSTHEEETFLYPSRRECKKMTERLSFFDGGFVIFAKICQTVGFPSESVRVTNMSYSKSPQSQVIF